MGCLGSMELGIGEWFGARQSSAGRSGREGC